MRTTPTIRTTLLTSIATGALALSATVAHAEHVPSGDPEPRGHRGRPGEEGHSTPRDDEGLHDVPDLALGASLTVLGGGSTRDEEPGFVVGDGEEEETGHLVTGLHLQELEIRASALADSYFAAHMTLTADADEIGFEEAYLSTLEIPVVTIRAGQMFADFGQHNLLHTHEFPFLTAPLPSRALLGAEGLKDVGFAADVRVPMPFFTEVNLQVLRGEWTPFEGGTEDDPATAVDESVPDARNPEDFAYLGHLKTLFELGDSTQLEVGGTWVGGRNGWAELSQIAGGDVGLRWRPIEAPHSTEIDWTTEIIWVKRAGDPSNVESAGAYSGLRYRFIERWWVQGRGAVIGMRDTDQTWRGEGLIGFAPSDKSLLRVQYGYEAGDELPDPVHEVFLQATVTIGSHASHEH